jgi:hypothetical protein
VDLVLSASKAIRLERNAAFSHPVELRGDRISITFEPIEGDPPRLRVPFEVSLPRGRAGSGFIWLWTGDPLMLVFRQPPKRPDEGVVWAATLLAFADLTVWPDSEPAQRTQTPHQGRQRWTPPTPRRRQLPQRRTISETTPWRSAGLNIEALRANMVVAHKRWLPDGREASAEKMREAAALGITLEPGQTWVTAHARGGNIGAPLKVSVIWEPSKLLSSLLQL